MATKDLTAGQVAKFSFVCVKTVHEWFNKGMLKGYRVPGSTYRRFRPADLAAFLQKHEVPVSEELMRLV